MKRCGFTNQNDRKQDACAKLSAKNSNLGVILADWKHVSFVVFWVLTLKSGKWVEDSRVESSTLKMEEHWYPLTRLYCHNLEDNMNLHCLESLKSYTLYGSIHN